MPDKEKGKDFKRKPNDKKGSKDKVDKPYGTKGFGDNDISWWTMSEQILNDVGRLPFGRPLGNAQEVGLSGFKYTPGPGWSENRYNAKVVIPGIAVINYKNTFGISGDSASPINVAARAIYSYVRHANSGHTNYESPDLMVYLFAVGEIYTAIAYLTKIYGMAQFWSQRNRYYGDRIITAHGFDATDIRNHLNDLRAGINVLSVKANSLVVPKMFPIYQRRYFLPTNIYKDNDNEKAQVYSFRPLSIGRFSGTKVSTGSALIPYAAPWSSNCTVKDAIDFISDLLDEMLAEEDLGIMGGDVLKAFSSEGVHSLLQIPDNYVCVPIYNEEMLQQIHNLSIGVYSQPVQPSDWETYALTVNSDNDILRERAGGILAQRNGYLLTENTVRNYTASISVGRITIADNTGYIGGETIPMPKLAELVIDTHLDNPTPADVMIATRLAFDLSDTSYSFAGAMHNIIRSLGTEGIINIDVTDTNETRTLSSKVVLESRCEYGQGTLYKTVVGVADDSNNTYEDDHRASLMLLKFRKAPVLMNLLMDYTFKTDGYPDWANSVFQLTFLNDVDVTYASVINSRVLENLHQTAMLSVFKVPQMGMWNISK